MASEFHPEEYTHGKSEEEPSDTLVRVVFHEWAGH
jgi:hypothetical protein